MIEAGLIIAGIGALAAILTIAWVYMTSKYD
jgi:hypothetical protein